MKSPPLSRMERKERGGVEDNGGMRPQVRICSSSEHISTDLSEMKNASNPIPCKYDIQYTAEINTVCLNEDKN